jgi:hypothetical protein
MHYFYPETCYSDKIEQIDWIDLIDLIEQIENRPIESGLIMPNIKQCMQLVNRAWYKVSDNSIINCWGKCRILSNFEGSEKLDLIINYLNSMYW